MTIKKINKDLNYYLNLPWTYTLEEDVDNEDKKIYIVTVNELLGVKTHGYSIEEAFEEIKNALLGTLELYLEMGDKIPEPKKLSERKFKGNIPYRTTQEIHQKLAQEAKRRKKPINKLIDEYVSKGLFAKKK